LAGALEDLETKIQVVDLDGRLAILL